MQSKNKGKRLEYAVRDFFRRHIDPACERQVMSGADAWHKGDIRFSYRHFPFQIECKNQERYDFWQWWKQAQDQTGEFDKPVLIFSKANKNIIVAMKIEDWMEILEELHDYRIQAETPKTNETTCTHQKDSWRLKNAIKLIKEYQREDL